ncbi:peptidoglycan-binding protein [Peribacillus simplex]|uniref:Peptidoglycan L-alanyl-D-glutamate endopeptidase CwlK n=1 Tax=Peribacillus simplex TaxID=1478 RepID=A0A9W4L702_9BACI|nr:peptidoglycan-binding protein [Peribacillus simplex]MDR4924939.1 M15 family metallopeptidase [Peribacillus simplex]WHX90345.1 M15 family metallopeptidase [Peribacillus simplex]CAH0294066.1 Peptidoglycan L-alanyl-D-glutamate endopeptidase CwlK [Peribacillus simplex]
MTVALRTLLDRSVKRMGKGMNPVVKASALEMMERTYNEGIYVQISAGYRSLEEQASLYGQGRVYIYNGKNYSNLAKPIVTNAKPGQSYHNYGLAIDFFIVSDDGKKAIWTVNSKWQRVAAIGKDLGFKWGGDWSSFKDYPHLEMTGGLSFKQLQAGKKPHITSSKTSKGDGHIISIQKTLNSRYKTNIEGDGFYGPKTRSALIKGLQTELNKQYNKKLVVDGKWGPKTKTAIVTIKKGASCNITWILQAALYMEGFNPGPLDGEFGGKTEAALFKYQKASRISADKLAGQETWNELLA